jgi:hypothetical protein
VMGNLDVSGCQRLGAVRPNFPAERVVRRR